MPLICYVTFESNPTKEYAYFCGALTPEPGGFVVILVGGDRDKKKIVKCSRVSSDPDPHATASLFGVVVSQPGL